MARPDIRVITTDVLIVGSGAAGMRAAIAARDAGAEVVLVTKAGLRASNTRMSAGRYNVVTGTDPSDSVELFFKDTIAGGSINNQALVRVLVDDALERAYDLESYGLVWQRKTERQYLAVGSPGCSRPRAILPFDEGTGFGEVLLHECWGRDVAIREFHLLVDVLRAAGGRVTGGLVLDLRRGEWILYDCPSVIIATGGTSELYETNSGAAVNTGDGIAVAYRAGAELVDMEQMQFIPIAFVSPPSARGVTLSEPHNYGMRLADPKGEPARLLNEGGERFLLQHDPIAREAAPRELISRAIMLEIIEGRGTPQGGVWLEPDPRILPTFLRGRPAFVKRILENYGSRAARFEERFQVTPSAFYTIGGVRIDESGRTTVPGLFAAGEAAGGVHGASQLGASSLPETQVFGRRAGIAAAREAAECDRLRLELDPARERAEALERPLRRSDGIRPVHARSQLQALMWNQVGLVRGGSGLSDALVRFGTLRRDVLPRLSSTRPVRVLNREWQEAIELENMLDVAEAMATSALAREETRSAHFRQDRPEQNDAEWLANLYCRREEGRARVEKRPLVTLAPSAPAAPVEAAR